MPDRIFRTHSRSYWSNARGCLGAFPRRRVDEGPASSHQMRQPPALLLFVLDAFDAEVDVRPIETGDQHPRLLEAKQRDDVVAHFGCRRRRERGDWWPA